MNSKYLTEVNDIFFINERIQEINQNYKLYYNKQLKRYEIHDTNNKFCTFCISFKNYPTSAILKKLFLTNKTNIKNTLKTIEEENLKLDKVKEAKIIDDSSEKLKEIFNFASLQTQPLSSSKINKIIQD